MIKKIVGSLIMIALVATFAVAPAAYARENNQGLHLGLINHNNTEVQLDSANQVILNQNHGYTITTEKGVCMSNAVKVRDEAIIAARKVQYDGLIAALTTRETSLSNAWTSSTDMRTIKINTKLAWKTWKDGRAVAQTTVRAAVEKAWIDFISVRKNNCHAEADGNGSASDHVN